MTSSFADFEANRSPYSKYEPHAGDVVTWPLSASEKQQWGEFAIDARQAKIVLDDPLQSPEIKYFAAAMYVDFLVDYSGFDEARYYCQTYPPKFDHFEYRGNCLRMGKGSIEFIAEALHELGETAHKELPERLSANQVYDGLGRFLNERGRIHAAIDAYKKALQVTPADQEDAIVQSKLSLAIVYANPLLSKELQLNSLQYYAEIRDWYAKQNPQPGNHAFIQMKVAIYNRGVAYLLNFQDYKAALAEFKQVEDFKFIDVDSKVFSAYAYAKNNQPELAEATLKSISWDQSNDPVRNAFLKCYVEITERILGRGTPLKACFALEHPQTDVLLDLTSTLAELKLSQSEENKNLRMFYRFFVDHLKPDIQNSLGSAITGADLEREKAESRLKSLQLKNMSLYQYLSYALLGIAAVCGAALLIALRSWRSSRQHALQMSEGRAQLQSIIDNVEEGLVRIGPNLTLIPQVSSHLLRITGDRNFQGQKLQDLFALTDLDGDRIATALQSVEACLGEDSLAWTMNEHNLPVAAQILGREIALFWQAEKSGDIVQSLLLVLRDVTEINELHRRTADERERADQLLTYAREIIGGNPRVIRMFMAELPQLMQQLQAFAQTENISEIKKLAHMIKGAARTLGLSALQNAMHSFEDSLKTESSTAWKELVGSIEDIAKAYGCAADHVLGKGEQGGVQTLFDLIAMVKPGLEKQLRQADITLGSFTVQEDVPLAATDLEHLREVILHGLTNAADHGFILPRQQGRQVAPSAAFHIQITREAQSNVLVLRDNGVGINHQKIREMAAKRNWQPTQDQIWSDFLFQEGVSTADNLSVTSGRGVGLAAIFAAAQHLGGSVKLLDNDKGPGGMIKLVWPLPNAAAA